ncbi:MAG: hypothetical protein DMF85_10665 [Acidobacteria bacterium]|nr:MAG: hypothetical protein DMF85_10665 [Acidobacteriota bacterium]
MISYVRRALAAALAGALAGAASLVVAFRLHPAVTMEMDRDAPRILSGFYDPEQYRDETFAWSSPRADVRLPDLDRRVEWQCVVRFRGGRPGGVAQPKVDLAVDGITLVSVTAPDLYQDVNVIVPPRSRQDGLQLTIVTDRPFVPGPADTRRLGVQVDRIACRPGAGALPPRRGLAVAALAGAAFGAGFAIVATLTWSVAAAAALAVAQAIPLSTGQALYTRYVGGVPWIAIWTVVPLVLGALAIERLTRRPLDRAAGFVLAYSAAAAYLLLLALLHPDKSIIDAVFHAHRLEWVLGGRYFFTQPMPSGVSFPYAIALYVAAAPFASLTRDHVALLRVVVCAWQVIAGLLLYPAIARSWGDRFTGAVAVALFTLVPIAYIVVGNANLTNAFGQSAATIAMLAAVAWPLRARDFLQAGGLFVLASIAFLSHVSTFPLLFVSLTGLAVLCSRLGAPAERSAARAIFIATVAAAVFAVVAYYGRFGEVYKSLDRLRGRVEVTAPAPPSSAALVIGDIGDASAAAVPPLARRVAEAVVLSVKAIGWPMAVLMVVGAWRLWKEGARDRLGLAVLAWFAAYLMFVAFGIFAPVDARFYRYTVEFLDRVNYAVVPGAVVVAARGAAWGWRAGVAARVAVTALLVAAAWIGVEHWAGWFGAA